MKIVMLGTLRPEMSGGMIMVFLIGDALRRLGHDARVVASAPRPAWAPVDVPWDQVSSDATSAAIGQADAVLSGWSGIEPALASGAPVVGQLVTGYEPHLWPTARELLERVYRLPTIKLVIAPHLKRTIKREMGLEATVIGAPIELSWFSPPAADPPGAPRILTVGPEPEGPMAPVPFKGIARVFDIVDRVRAEGRDPELVRLVPYADPLIDSPTVDERHVGVEPRATAAIYRSCQIYLSGSTPAEGLGMPAVEAASSGLAGVLPAIPSYLDIEGLDRAALFYEPGDRAGAAAQLARLLDDPELLSQLRREGPLLGLREQFSPLEVARRAAAAIEAAGGGSRPRL
jgi:glycosyltransferase involved in cell wall biosynthesis